MSNKLDLLGAEALKLTRDEREALVQQLLASLQDDASVSEAWAVEIERRIAEIESGEVDLMPVADALAQVRSTLK